MTIIGRALLSWTSVESASLLTLAPDGVASVRSKFVGLLHGGCAGWLCYRRPLQRHAAAGRPRRCRLMMCWRRESVFV